MKICTIVGARPQFIKAAALSRVLRKEHIEILIHTGQHYDANMSDIFFEELQIPKPDYNLGISGGGHGKMTGEMLIKIEEVLIKEKPDMVVLYGDTNSTLAGAIAAVKLHIPICHVEAGNRLGTLSNPEEVNRILTDKVSAFLFCCVESAVEFLKAEGQTKNVYLVGDPMYDAFCFYRGRLNEYKSNINAFDFDNEKITIPENYYYLTCHRPENESEDKLFEILSAMNSLEYKTIYPVHPRNKEKIYSICKKNNFKNIILTLPVSYLTSIYLVSNCTKVVTDSGGVQREAFFAKKQCVTVFNYIAWPETMAGNCNQLASPQKDDILAKLNVKPEWKNSYEPFGDGKACEKIVSIINSVG
ncbi:MAG: UDP-N-acetylglucosamine 2-epimerase (non-hydrolyzing) [Oscillospiraceae bacterium]|nr:UDP-N-acetylglucosamine 2-epimerase (non-hydrolyzing) [Oscillospiraceae bacterium]